MIYPDKPGFKKGKNMSKVSKYKKKEKRIRFPAEYTEGALHFKKGPGWQACYDSERELYTAVCDKCGKEAKLRFKPTEGRPVYCSECFAKKQAAAAADTVADAAEEVAEAVEEAAE